SAISLRECDFSKATIPQSSAILSSSGVARRAMNLSYIPSDATGHRSLSRPMRSEERMNLAHRERNSLLGFFPRENAHFSLWGEHRALHGDGVWVRRDLVGQDQDR